MAIGKDGKEIVVGSEQFVWEDEDKVKEFKDRRKKAKGEVKALPDGKKHLTFYLKRGYNTPYSLNTKVLYKRTIKKFRANGLPEYKPHYLTIKQGRIITSNSEEIAFMDMSKDFIRESERPLTPLEKERKERMRLEKELAIAKADTEKKSEDDKKEVEDTDTDTDKEKKSNDKKVENETSKTKG